MAGKLASVRWEMGQTLLPDHFIAQEESLRADSVLRSWIRGLPAFGLAKLAWNVSLLSEGIFSIRTLTMVMPSGLLLNIPSNTKIAPFNLNITGAVSVPIYCHLIKETSSEKTLDEDIDTIEEEVVRKIIYKIDLSSEQGHSAAIETMKLAEFNKNPEGIWQLSTNYIPPMLQIGTSPFLNEMIGALIQDLELFHYKLTQEVAASFLSGESLFNAKQCLKAVYHIQRLLGNVRSQIHIHPYYLYEALKSFYTEVCFYKNSSPEHIVSLYDHNQLGECFKKIIEPLRQLMRMVQARSPYLPFEKKDTIFHITLPADVREAKEVYFLIQKSYVNENVSLENIKLASFSRATLVHQMSLQGINLRKIDRPPFQHTFGSEVDFFRLVEGEEWDHALRELSVAFYDSSELKGLKFYLYWRMH